MTENTTATDAAAFAEVALHNMADQAITRDTEARQKLADAALKGLMLDTFTIKPALEAQAAALPWRHVLDRATKGRTLAEAVARVREDMTYLLVERSESQSTCAISNESDRMAREAARRFLSSTRRYA